jgi:hypothetical protein
MGKRRDRFDRRALDQKISRSENAPIKFKERARREARMKTLLKKGAWPYTRVVRNWLSVKFGKPESELTPDDAKKALA